MTDLDWSRLTPANEVRGEDPEETTALRGMLDEATRYLRGFDWCPPIAEQYMGCGFGRVLALFLFRFARKLRTGDEFLWVVVGDLPSAYFVTDDAPDPASALEVYCDLMEDWVNAVRERGPLADVFPVRATPTSECADMLARRISFIREQIVPRLDRSS